MPEAVTHTCSIKKVFLEILQNSQENPGLESPFIKKETLMQVLFCEFCEITKSTFSYRTSSVAASVIQTDLY